MCVSRVLSLCEVSEVDIEEMEAVGLTDCFITAGMSL